MLKYTKSLIKLILPVLAKIFIKLKVNRRVINYLSEKSYFSNSEYDFTDIIQSQLKQKKLLALDIGAQGGFNSDNFFSKKYDVFFEKILVEPIETAANNLKKNNKYVIQKGFWDTKTKKKIYIMENRLGSSSMFKPNKKLFDLHNIKKKDYSNYDVTKIEEVECDSLENSLKELNIKKLDYLKIDTQGSEFQILRGLGNYRPLLIKLEAHIFSMYDEVPGWQEILSLIYQLNYVLVDWKGIGSHSTRVPAEIDLIFVPNFNNDQGIEFIKKNEEKIISLLLIFGQINLLKIMLKKINSNFTRIISDFDDRYFN
tara:strand:- start:956 stop:1894 length:939 start_codon:yes stop_codon:yes gene_type:complete